MKGRWERIGTVALLQVQTARLKVPPVYDPSPLRAVARLRLGPDGVEGELDDAWVPDVHHRAHPQVRRFHPQRTVSVGFVSHHRAIVGRFRDVPLGAGGENVVIDDTDSRRDRWWADDLHALSFRRGGEEVRLGALAPAAPCVPFARYMLGGEVPDDAPSVREGLAFLGEGMRGFVTGTGHLRGAVMDVGMEVWRRVPG